MATIFSDLYTDTLATALGSAANTAIPGYITSAGKSHGRRRYKFARVVFATIGGTIADKAIVATFKSGDRLTDILVSSGSGTSTALTADLGIYRAGYNHDGALLDVDMFGNAVALNGTLARVDHFAINNISNEDRGKALWELVNIAVVAGGGAAPFAVDPLIELDLVFTADATILTSHANVNVEMMYQAGD